MSDETQTTDAPTEEPKQQVVFNSQQDFDAVIQNRLAKEKAKYSDYEETKAKLEQLTREAKERQEAEMSELEKANSHIEELKSQVEELKPFKEKLTDYELEQEEKLIKQMDEAEFTDEQKERINKLPLMDRAGMIADLMVSKQISPPTTAGKYVPSVGPTKEQILAMPDGPEKRRLWGKYRANGGVTHL